MSKPQEMPPADPERQHLDADIICVGFGPAMGGFLTTLSRRLLREDGTPRFESACAPGQPLQVVCYERADDLGFGVSGVVTKARAIRASFPDLDPSQIPMATPVASEKMVCLLDPVGASRRSIALRIADRLIRLGKSFLPYCECGLELPYVPSFLHKTGGWIMSLGQFNQWVAAQLMSTGTVQLWPASPVTKAVIEGQRVTGVRLADQGADHQGNPEANYLPGPQIHAPLTVIGDGPVGPIGRQIDFKFGLPAGHHQREWAIGLKMVIDLRQDVELKPGTVFHTFGYPEPEIFGFLYVHPERIASLGIFVPSWFDSPIRTGYRYLQHWMLHPYLWRWLKGGRLRSWGAKSLQESGKRGEPYLVGDGYARIGENSGSTNVLTGSGVDEAWSTGAMLAEGVLQLLEEKAPFNRENLERAYVKRRQQSWVEAEGRVAGKSRQGFQHGILAGLIGLALTGLSKGRLALPGQPIQPYKRLPDLETYYRDRITAAQIGEIRQQCAAKGASLHEALMERCGWPAIPYDGQLLVTHQDALLLGGKVQAPPGYADHVVFLQPAVCRTCGARLCVEICSAQAITPGTDGVPVFDREKCVHCGACLWNCSQPFPGQTERTNIGFSAGAGGLHSAEN